MTRPQARHAAVITVTLAVVGFALAGAVLAASSGPAVWRPVVDPNAPASVTDVAEARVDRPGSAAREYVYQFAPRVSFERWRTEAPAPTVSPPMRIPGELGIPQIVLDAYRRAADGIATSDPSCQLGWEMLAGIGRVETHHARDGLVYADGTTFEPILGPVLDGSGHASIPDTDDGQYDGDDVWDRAVGPMQFIPGTWRWAGVDGNGDGRADPHNVYDAALAAGHYLCSGSADLADRAGLSAALLRYNHSDAYVALVLAWIDAYQAGEVTPLPPASTPAPTEPSVPPSSTTTPPTSEPTTSSTSPPTISIQPTVTITTPPTTDTTSPETTTVPPTR